MSHKTLHVALLIDTNRSYGRGLLRGVRSYVSKHGPWSIFMDLRSLDSPPPLWLKSWKGDGILVRTGNRALANAVSEAALPTVELRTSHFTTDKPFVGVDNAAVGKMVTQYLLDRGFRQFAVYGIGAELAYDARQDSFIQAVADAGYECKVFRHPHTKERHKDWETTQETVAQWVSGLAKPVGVMACTDQLGFWLLDACKRANMSVPEDIAVVSCENDEMLTSMSKPPMSSVQFQAELTGYTACELLTCLMAGDLSSPSSFFIPPLKIVTRQSSDIVAVEDGDIADTLVFIRENAFKGIRVEEVLRQIPVSRAALDQKMKAVVGRTVKAEILRVQLERVKQLLSETDLSLSQIADRTGFRHPQYMSELFKKKIGKTPGTYRTEFQF